MWKFDNVPVPRIKTSLPGPRAQALLERDQRFASPSYTRIYPLVAARGSGAVIEDLDGNLFLDFTAGIAVVSTGHCHPHVVAAIQDQAAKLIHMSGTDFYYEPQTDLAQRLAELSPGKSPKRVFFTNSGAEALEAGLKLARWHTGRSRAIAFLGAFHGRTYGAMSLSGSKLVHRRGFSPLVQPPLRMKWPPFLSNRSREKAAITFRPPISCRLYASCAIFTVFSSSPTRFKPVWDGRANYSPSSIGTWSRTSSAWPKESPAACPWAP